METLRSPRRALCRQASVHSGQGRSRAGGWARLVPEIQEKSPTECALQALAVERMKVLPGIGTVF